MKSRIILGLAAAIVLASCGGGGGGGTTTSPVNGQSVAVISAQGAALYEGAEAGTEAAVKTAAQTQSELAPFYNWLAEEATRAFSVTRAPANWTLIPGTTTLYAKLGTTTLNSTTILFSTNGTSNNAGSMQLTLETFPGSYPTVIDLSLNLIVATQTIKGTGKITLDDSSGKNYTLQMNLSSSATPISLAVTITEANGSPSVALTAKEGSMTIVFLDVSSTRSGLAATTSVDGVSGTVQLNTDGSGTSTATDTTGKWTLTWDASEDATLTSPTGATTTGSLATFPY